jgi:hypothetical protein
VPRRTPWFDLHKTTVRRLYHNQIICANITDVLYFTGEQNIRLLQRQIFLGELKSHVVTQTIFLYTVHFISNFTYTTVTGTKIPMLMQDLAI